MKSKLTGKIVTITNKEHDLYGEWGMIICYDGDCYHFSPWCTTIEEALKHPSYIFDRKEFRVKRNKTKV